VASLGGDTLNGQGYVKIKPTLQLLNHPSIFALGDIIDWPEQKQAAKLRWHVPIAVANIISFLDEAPLTKKYSGAPEMIVITNGRVSIMVEKFSMLTADVGVYRRVAWAIFRSSEGLRLVIGLPG